MLPFFGVQHFFYCPVTCVLFYKTELFELTHCLFYGHIKSFTDKLIEIIINNNFEALYSFETLFLRCNIFDSQYWGSRELVTFMLGSCTCGYADVTYRSQLLNNNKKKGTKTLYLEATDIFGLHSHMCATNVFKSCGQWP